MKQPIASSRKRRVWRITQDAPLGKYVDPNEEAAGSPLPQERFEPGWRQSSFDLAYGLDVSEAGETVPDDVMDELFRKPAR
jgi:hypothetical protein